VSVVDPPSQVWAHPALRIGRSQIAGRGLFATEDLAAGTVVLRLGGRLMGTHELEALLDVARADTGARYVDSITVYEDRHLVLPSGTAAHWCNHSCDPNLWHVGPYEIAARRLGDWRRPDLRERYRGHWTPALQTLIDRT
jgi:uncharacterized protein